MSHDVDDFIFIFSIARYFTQLCMCSMTMWTML